MKNDYDALNQRIENEIESETENNTQNTPESSPLPEKFDLLDRYFAAMSNFYQLIPLKRVFKIISEQYGEPYALDEFLEFAESVRLENRHYYYILSREEIIDEDYEYDGDLLDTLLVHESIIAVDLDIFLTLEEAKKEKPYYVPPKEALLNYADDRYMEKTPQYEAMAAFIKKETGYGDQEVENIMSEILFQVKTEDSSPDEALDFAGMFDPKMRFYGKRYDLFSELYRELHNGTNNPYINGYTPDELYDITGNAEKSYLLQKISYKKIPLNVFAEERDGTSPQYSETPEIPEKKAKVGRNDPCPCGSGKKYKKCCGQ